MTEGMQSGDDTPLKNIWDEVCVQMQTEQSALWEAYEDTMLRLIEYEMNKQNRKIIEAIWLQTEEGEDWDEENESNDEENIISRDDRHYDSEFYFVEFGSKAPTTQNEIPDTVEYNLEDVTQYILNEYVLETARRWKNKRIEKFLDEECCL